MSMSRRGRRTEYKRAIIEAKGAMADGSRCQSECASSLGDVLVHPDSSLLVTEYSLAACWVQRLQSRWFYALVSTG